MRDSKKNDPDLVVLPLHLHHSPIVDPMTQSRNPRNGEKIAMGE